MTKEILSITKDRYETEVNLKVPSFLNFGARMAELEQQSLDALMESAAEAPAAGEGGNMALDCDWDAPIPDLGSIFADMARAQLEARKATLTPEEYAQASAQIAEIPNQPWNQVDEDELQAVIDDGDDTDSDDEEDGDHDLQELRVVCPPKSGWVGADEAKFDRLLGEWPALRSQVLQALCDYYAELHRENELPEDPILLPKPGSPQIVEDRCHIDTIFLREDGLIGLSGNCTWDDEHGFGVLMEDGRVIDAGHASVAYEERYVED